MDIGKIIGKVVATVKDPSLVGLRLFVVQRISQNHEPVGSAIVAVDVDGIAGIGDIVYVVSGGDAAFAHANREIPTDITIVGLVDSITITSETNSIGEK